MPLFDFVCKKCGREFEALIMGADKPQCPDCGSGKVEKQMSRYAVRGGGSKGNSSCSGCSGGNCSSCH